MGPGEAGSRWEQMGADRSRWKQTAGGEVKRPGTADGSAEASQQTRCEHFQLWARRRLKGFDETKINQGSKKWQEMTRHGKK